MKVYSEISLESFEAWSGGQDTLDKVIEAGKCDLLESIIDDLYPDGISENQLNDLLRFESESVFEWCGISEEDEEDEEDKDFQNAFDEFCGKYESCATCPYNHTSTMSECEELFRNDHY